MNPSEVQILVVDDLPEDLHAMAQLLENEGYPVRRASNAGEAFQAIQERRPDMLLLDHGMPGIDGSEVCRRIKADVALADIYVILLSASGSQPEGPDAGADGHIERPAGDRELLALVAAHARIHLLNRSLLSCAADLKQSNQDNMRTRLASLNLAEDAVSARDRLADVNQKLREEIAGHQQVRKSLQESEERYRQLFDTMLDGFALHEIICDSAGRPVNYRFLSVNAAFERMTGLCAADVIGKTVLDILPETEPGWIEKFGRVALTGESIQFQDHSSSLRRSFEVSAFCPRPGQFATLFMDITEVRQVELALKVSENRFRMLLENVNSIAVQGFRLDGTIQFWNHASELLYGYTDEEALGRNLLDLIIPPNMREDVRRAIEESGRTGINIPPSELTLRRKDGSEAAVFSSHAIVLVPGREPEFFCMDIDLTERKQAEAAHARLSMAVEQADETIVITDKLGTIIYANPAFEKSTGYTPAEALGQNPRILKSGRHDAGFYRQMWETLERGEMWRGHMINKRKDGKLYEEDATISPIRDAAGTVLNYVAVKRDVTHEMEMEAQFRQSQKMESVGLLAGGVAHDFNNILSVIMMQIDLIGTDDSTPEQVREGLSMILTATNHAANLTRQLLLFSRKQVMHPRHLDLNEVVISLTKMLQRTIRENVQLQLNLHSGPVRTRADAGMVDQMLINLAINARDAMPEGGRLIIETFEKTIDSEEAARNIESRPGRWTVLSVSDSGCGMSPEIQARIFEPFFTTKEPGRGTGLGLSTVFGIVKQHQGWVRVYSEVGKGTTFQIYLPADEGSVLEVAAEGSAAKLEPVGGSESILLVEDDPSVRTVTRELLRRNGYQVFVAEDGIEAQQVWEKHRDRIDVLLTDLVMPGGVHGGTLAAILQGLNPDLRVIFTSGYSSEIAGREMKLEAGQYFIQKPCPSRELLETLRKCLDTPYGPDSRSPGMREPGAQ